MRRALLGLMCFGVLTSCATEDPPRLDVRVHGEAFVDVDQLIFMLRIGDGAARQVGGRVYDLAPEGIDLTAGPAIFGLREADIRGPVTVYVVGCALNSARCDTDDLVDAPACTCDTPQAVGVAQAQVEGLTRLDVFLNRFVSACDGDGDLFLDCTRPGCCADMPAEAIGDCDDVPRDCPDGRCHGRNAHPFHAAELDFESASTDDQRTRHLAWCGDTLDNDCRDGDVACGGNDQDGDGVPAPADCDDADPDTFPGNVENATTRCSDGVDNDCEGGDVRCDADGDGVDDLSDCDDTNPDRFPNNPERCGDDVDQDCDDYDPPCISDDLDGDGYLCPVENSWDDHGCDGALNGRPLDCDDLEAGVFPGAPERCNGRDDDCDTQVDEDCPPDDVDQDGVADVNRGGSDCVDDDPTIHPGAPERCGDGVDQDCDGRDTPCAVDGDGDGYDASTDCQDDNPQVHPWAPEWCNQIDDDCDGRVDEGNPRQSAPDGIMQPERCGRTCPDCACRLAPLVCSTNGGNNPPGQQYVCLGVEQNQIPETTCDGIDQDCDGAWDEDISQACYDDDMGLIGIGICIGGTQRCTAERGSGVALWGMCDEQVLPEPRETCNGLDDDCNSAVDEGVQVESCYTGPDGTAGQGICRRGERRCQGVDGWGRCQGDVTPDDEQCNALDDDCDGQTDEGYDLGQLCRRGRGDCQAEGVFVCDDAGGQRCDAQPGRPRGEVCDGRDNDCDGEVDNGVLNRCGACGQEPDEVCDGDDNDCDGQTDEGVLNRCGMCGQEPAEACDGQDNDCDGQTDEGVLNRCGMCGQEPPEECNGRDDDCDGDIDEGVERNACGECGPLPNEVCDGEDNDCDRQVDEGVVNACGECGEVPREECNGRDDDCDGDVDEGVANACGDCGPVPDEVCDGANDEDCDGVVDEGFNPDCTDCQEPCNGPRVDRCVSGRCVCGPLGRRCAENERCRDGACFR
jgi:hypothetical protein